MHIYDYSFLKKTVPGNFLQVLYKCYKDLDELFTDISLKKAKKSEKFEVRHYAAIAVLRKSK